MKEITKLTEIMIEQVDELFGFLKFGPDAKFEDVYEVFVWGFLLLLSTRFFLLSLFLPHQNDAFFHFFISSFILSLFLLFILLNLSNSHKIHIKFI
jgi:hypothetical protein